MNKIIDRLVAMNKIPFFLFLISLPCIYSCTKEKIDTSSKSCSVAFEIDGFDCREISSSCSQMTITVTRSIPTFGWTLAFEYSGCGETGKVDIERTNNGCIEKITQTCN